MLRAKAGRKIIASILKPLLMDARAAMLDSFNRPRILNRRMLVMFQAICRNAAGHPMLIMVLIVPNDTVLGLENIDLHLSLIPRKTRFMMVPETVAMAV